MYLQTIAEEACALIWVLMDHNPQLMEELTHTNLEALGVPLSTSASAALSTVMVRAPGGRPALEDAVLALPDLPAFLGDLGGDLGLPTQALNPPTLPTDSAQASHSELTAIAICIDACFMKACSCEFIVPACMWACRHALRLSPDQAMLSCLATCGVLVGHQGAVLCIIENLLKVACHVTAATCVDIGGLLHAAGLELNSPAGGVATGDKTCPSEQPESLNGREE